ncbi:MAG: 3-oxoacyl-[acyl-carrier-protein] synthase III C-terminal domain-containing protein [Myxococcota bacterium]
MNSPAFITSTGAFLPGPALSIDELEPILGLVDGRPSRLKKRILEANGIHTRHYAINAAHETVYSNEDMATEAALACLAGTGVRPHDIGMLSCATSQGDRVLPGFASMVQGRLKIPAVEIHSAHGICSSGAMALRAAVNSVRLGDHERALVVSSELASRLFKHTRYEAAGGQDNIDLQAAFLRWMLSDGAGAFLVEAKPRGLSLRVDWMRAFSHADAYGVCMSVGAPTDKTDTRTWQDFPTYAEAEAAGALLIRQDIRLLENILRLGVDGCLRLIDEGALDVNAIDHFLCHYSSHHFKGRVFKLLEMAGALIPEEKWYTNLYHRGNTGCASIFIMLDEFLRDGRASPGDTILCMVPESGRFNTAYIHLTVVEDA